MVSMRGSLIIVEGVDRSGKSTQSANLVARLNKAKPESAVAWRFPDRTTPTGLLINSYLSNAADFDDRTIHLLFAANRAEAMAKLKQTLLDGKTVVVDRYAFSGVAYTLAKETAGLDKNWCKAVDAGILQPDLVFFLDIPTVDASLRGDYGAERYERVDFQEKVRSRFLDLEDERYWVILNARESKETLAERILELANTTIQQSANKPLLPLWQ
ncbi:UNVERIFIED_CONTAM: hypothetical protein HDU68_007680 [Siphonaria sp. JEL0065]|nr:hypothetical protein HDU68_007680 [Siphonaria sp. JEL0065]